MCTIRELDIELERLWAPRTWNLESFASSTEGYVMTKNLETWPWTWNTLFKCEPMAEPPKGQEALRFFDRPWKISFKSEPFLTEICHDLKDFRHWPGDGARARLGISQKCLRSTR